MSLSKAKLTVLALAAVVCSACVDRNARLPESEPAGDLPVQPVPPATEQPDNPAIPQTRDSNVPPPDSPAIREN